jgi:hypothetical protein
VWKLLFRAELLPSGFDTTIHLVNIASICNICKICNRRFVTGKIAAIGGQGANYLTLHSTPPHLWQYWVPDNYGVIHIIAGDEIFQVSHFTHTVWFGTVGNLNLIKWSQNGPTAKKWGKLSHFAS